MCPAMGYLVSNGGEWAGAAALGSFKDFATTKFLGINCVIWVVILCYVILFHGYEMDQNQEE